MLGISMLRFVSAFSLLLASVVSMSAPAAAVTIIVPSDASSRSAVDRKGASEGGGSWAIGQVVLLPSDDLSAMWPLLAGGGALIGAVMRRKRRMPSVTS